MKNCNNFTESALDSPGLRRAHPLRHPAVYGGPWGFSDRWLVISGWPPADLGSVSPYGQPLRKVRAIRCFRKGVP